jgi:hypothetical protein
MKHLKILGLGLMAAVALMAFVGAGTASATVLEKGGGVKMTAGEEIDASMEGTAILESGVTTMGCSEGSGRSMIENPGGAEATVSGTTLSVALPNCGCGSNEVTNGTFEVHSIPGTSNGTLTGSGFTWTMNCNSPFGKYVCRYITGTNKDFGTLTGSNSTGSTATVDISTTLTKEEPSSGLCYEVIAFRATYVVTAPDVLNVTAS